MSRYWILDALPDEDTSDSNRINEVSAAAGFPMVGLVDELAGGVIGYLHEIVSEIIVDSLNASKENLNVA